MTSTETHHVTPDQIDFFQTFGFVVLRGLLSPSDMTTLRSEVEQCHDDAFRDVVERPEGEGLPSFLLPMMSLNRTPTSVALMEDERFLGVAGALTGGAVLPTFAESILLFTQTPLHRDCIPGMQGITFAVYLDALSADNGALRFVPASHHLDSSAAVADWKERYGIWAEGDWAGQPVQEQVENLPMWTAETSLGDVIAFDWQVWHASINGRDRLQWSVSYAKDPAPEEEARFSSFFHSAGSFDPEAMYDTTAYPRYDLEWIQSARHDPERAAYIDRMTELGMLDEQLGLGRFTTSTADA